MYLDKKRIQTLINQQRTNLADVEYLDLNSIANIIETFANPQISEGENSGEQENLTSEDSNTRMKVEDQWQDMLTDKEREAMQTEHDAVDEGGYGLDSPEVRESIHQKIDERYKAKAMKRNDSDGNVRMSASRKSVRPTLFPLQSTPPRKERCLICTL